MVELEIIKCKGRSYCKPEWDIELWLADKNPYLQFFAIKETINWDLPISNKKPIFENVVHAGAIYIGDKFTTGTIMDLEVNKVTLKDDPFGFSKSEFTYLGFRHEFE